MVARRALVGAALALALAGVAGCSSQTPQVREGEPHPQSQSQAPTRGSEEGKTFKFKKGPVDKKEFVDAVSKAQLATKSGRVESKSKRGAETMDSVTEFEIIDGVERSHTVVNLGEMEAETISIGDKTWTKTGDKWALSQGITIGSNNADSMSKFAEAITKAEYQGEDSHGHKFEVEADISESVGKDTKLPATLWLDDEMRLVRGEYKVDLGDGEMESVTTRGDFGKKFDIQEPKVG